MVYRLPLAALLPALLSGCAVAADSPEQEDGYVLLDRGARGALTLEVDGWKGTPLLPMAIDVSELVTLKTSSGLSTTIDLSPGMLAYVHDAEGRVEWMEVGREVRSDRLLLHGSEQSARDVALVLGGSVSARGDGLWNLSVPDVFTRTSFVDAPEGLLEALPDVALDAGDIGDIDSAGAVDSAIMGPDRVDLAADADEVAPGRREALFVGVYTSVATTLLLDASGRFSMEDRCTGDVKREGHYYISGGRVVLQARVVPTLALEIEKDSLILTSGERLRFLEPSWALAGQGGQP